MTRLELRNGVIENISRTDKNTQINGRLKDVQRKIVSIAGSRDFGEHDFKSLKVDTSIYTVATFADVSLPSNNRLVISIDLDDGSNSRPLVYKFPALFRKLYPKPTLSSGSPYFYTWSTSAKITLDKAADKAYSLILNYSKWPNSLLEDTDEIEMVGLDDIIISYITYRMYLSMGVESDVGVINDVLMWKDLFEKDLLKVVEEDALIKDWTPVARAFEAIPTGYYGEYWKNPFIK